jgi:hypothetical protein
MFGGKYRGLHTSTYYLAAFAARREHGGYVFYMDVNPRETRNPGRSSRQCTARNPGPEDNDMMKCPFWSWFGLDF